jgi:hypothetical protein
MLAPSTIAHDVRWSDHNEIAIWLRRVTFDSYLMDSIFSHLPRFKMGDSHEYGTSLPLAVSIRTVKLMIANPLDYIISNDSSALHPW